MTFLSVSINGTNMLETYKMALKDRHCVQPPVPKTAYQDIPGADGSLDMSEANAGHIVYNRRKITLNFGCGNRPKDWPGIFSEVMRKFHGQTGKIIFDDDPEYYYIGRMAVSGYKRAGTLGTFTVTIDADPYKYELMAGDEDWLWDPFDLETGVIREYGGLKVDGSHELIIDGTEKWTIPEIVASADMDVMFQGEEYRLKAGANKIYGIVIKEGENLLTFRGNGTVSVKYRGAIL